MKESFFVDSMFVCVCNCFLQDCSPCTKEEILLQAETIYEEASSLILPCF